MNGLDRSGCLVEGIAAIPENLFRTSGILPTCDFRPWILPANQTSDLQALGAVQPDLCCDSFNLNLNVTCVATI